MDESDADMRRIGLCASAAVLFAVPAFAAPVSPSGLAPAGPVTGAEVVFCDQGTPLVTKGCTAAQIAALAQASSLQKTNNLGDIINPLTARLNIRAAGSPNSSVVGDVATFADTTGLPLADTSPTALSVTAANGSNPRARGAHFSSPLDILDYGSICNSASIQSAINQAQSQGGGKVLLHAGTVCQIATTLTITASNVGIGCDQPTVESIHNVAFTPTGCVLKWVGGSGGTVLSITSAVGVGNTILTGDSVSGVAFDGNSGLAANAMLVKTQRAGVFENLYAQYFNGGVVFNFDMIQPTATTFADYCGDQYNRIQNISINQSQGSSVGFRLGAWLDPSFAGCNASLNTIRELDIFYSTGEAVQLYGADNNLFQNVRTFKSSGAVAGLDLQIAHFGSLWYSSNSNTFIEYTGNGPILAQGQTADPSCTIWPNLTANTCTYGNIFYSLDKGNGTPDPTLETGAVARWFNNDGTAGGRVMFGPTVFGETYVNQAKCTPIGTTSLCIFNSGANHMVLTDGTNSWGINLNGVNLRINKVAGAGVNVEVPNLNSLGGYLVGGVAGVTCAGAPTGSFASTNGIVTHC